MQAFFLFQWFTQWKPCLSQGQTQLVSGTNRGRRAAENVYVVPFSLATAVQEVLIDIVVISGPEKGTNIKNFAGNPPLPDPPSNGPLTPQILFVGASFPSKQEKGQTWRIWGGGGGFEGPQNSLCGNSLRALFAPDSQSCLCVLCWCRWGIGFLSRTSSDANTAHAISKLNHTGTGLWEHFIGGHRVEQAHGCWITDADRLSLNVSNRMIPIFKVKNTVQFTHNTVRKLIILGHFTSLWSSLSISAVYSGKRLPTNNSG